MITKLFKVGDVVVCVENPNAIEKVMDNNGRGQGWELGHKFTIKSLGLNNETESNASREVAWPIGGGPGVYLEYLKHLEDVHPPVASDFRTYMRDKKVLV